VQPSDSPALLRCDAVSGGVPPSQLVLAGLESRGAGHLLAEMQKTANLVSQFREGLVISHPDSSAHVVMSSSGCTNIVSRHIAGGKVLRSHEITVPETRKRKHDLRCNFHKAGRFPRLLRRVVAGNGFSHSDYGKTFAAGQRNIESLDFFVAMGAIQGLAGQG
jgi:hypothetical protein